MWTKFSIEIKWNQIIRDKIENKKIKKKIKI
jgi:hypothetical protein